MGRLRLPECLCLVSRRPFFGIFNSVLATAQALRLLVLSSSSATPGVNGSSQVRWIRLDWIGLDGTNFKEYMTKLWALSLFFCSLQFFLFLIFPHPPPKNNLFLPFFVANQQSHRPNGKLEELLGQLLAGGTRGSGVPGPGQDLVARGLRFVRPVDEHLSLNEVPVTPLLVGAL